MISKEVETIYYKNTFSQSYFSNSLCAMTCLSLTLCKKTLKRSTQKNVSIPRMDEKKLHTQEFQLKGISRNMRCKLLQKRSTGKTTECSKHLQHIAIEKDIFSELNNRCIFQISLKYIKLAIPKILFILILSSFNFYFKITWPAPPPPPPTKIKTSDPPAKTFLTFLPPPPSWRGGVGCMPWKKISFKHKHNNNYDQFTVAGKTLL